MQILHILEATAGGTRRHVLDLLPALSRRGFRCSLIYSPLRNPNFETDAAYLQSQNIQTHCVPMTRSWDNAIDIAALASIRSIIAKSTFDVIHAHSSKAGFLGRLAIAPSHESTFVYTPHCIAINTMLPRRQKRLARIAEIILANLTDEYIAVSLQEKRAILRAQFTSTKNVSLIYNGVDSTNFAVKEKPFDNAVFTIGCFGRLSHQKNQEFALKVLSQLRKQRKDIKMLFVGDGEEKKSLQQLSNILQIEEAVIWHEPTANPENLYTQCDVIIQPSRWEGCPYTVLEAMAHGLPVLASPAGAMPQQLKSCGEIHSLSRINQWVETLLSWRSNPQRRRDLGATAACRVQKYFSLEHMVDQTINVYLSKSNS